MPCYIRIFAGIFEQARISYDITPDEEEKEQLEELLKEKLEQLSSKPIKTHQELRRELLRIQKEDPLTFIKLEQWLLEQLRKLRQKLQKDKKKRKQISLYA
jgi:glycyl-tRNA synthetase (class II)